MAYSLVNDSQQSDVTLTTQFGSWSYNGNGVEQNMPYLGHESNGILTTSEHANSAWWGTLVSSHSSFDPAPWMYTAGMGSPGIIWYWMRSYAAVQ